MTPVGRLYWVGHAYQTILKQVLDSGYLWFVSSAVYRPYTVTWAVSMSWNTCLRIPWCRTRTDIPIYFGLHPSLVTVCSSFCMLCLGCLRWVDLVLCCLLWFDFICVVVVCGGVLLLPATFWCLRFASSKPVRKFSVCSWRRRSHTYREWHII